MFIFSTIIAIVFAFSLAYAITALLTSMSNELGYKDPKYKDYATGPLQFSASKHMNNTQNANTAQNMNNTQTINNLQKNT